MNLAPLSPQKVHEMQVKMSKDKSNGAKPNFLVNTSEVRRALTNTSHTVLLLVFKELLSAGSVNVELPKDISQLLDRFVDVFPEEIPAGCHQAEALSIRLISSLVHNSQIDQLIMSIQRKLKSLNDK